MALRLLDWRLLLLWLLLRLLLQRPAGLQPAICQGEGAAAIRILRLLMLLPRRCW